MRTNDVMLQTATKVVTFIILMFAVHILFAGHYTPGGGFGVGLLTATAIVLLTLAYDIDTVKKIIPFTHVMMTATGLLFAPGTARASIFFNVPLFTHAYDYFD